MKYDTDEMRRIARQLGTAASDVKNVATGDVQSMISGLGSALEGDAGNALDDELTALKNEAQSLASELTSMQQGLLAFAAWVEEMDRKAASSIGTNGG